MTKSLIAVFVVTLIITYLIITARRYFKNMKAVPDGNKIKVLTDQTFAARIKTGTHLVDFWADWCMPCKMMVPVLNELSEELDGKVTIAKVNVDESRSTAAKFGIRSIPTMILFKNGKETQRITGVKTKDQLLKQLSK